MIIRYIAALWRWFVRQGYPCLFRLLTGLYCPGCGGTRALKYLLRGQVFVSLYYHPLVLYMVVTALTEGCLWAVEKMKRSRNRDRVYHRRQRPYEKEVYVGIGIIVLNWAVKNWVLVVKGISMVP